MITPVRQVRTCLPPPPLVMIENKFISQLLEQLDTKNI